MLAIIGGSGLTQLANLNVVRREVVRVITPGTVVEAGDRPHKPGAAPRPYLVRWDNGVLNSYREDDLTQALPEDAPAGNVIAFRR